MSHKTRRLYLTLEEPLWELLARYSRLTRRYKSNKFKIRLKVARETRLGDCASEFLRAALLERADDINEQYDNLLKDHYCRVAYRLDCPITYKTASASFEISDSPGTGDGGTTERGDSE